MLVNGCIGQWMCWSVRGWVNQSIDELTNPSITQPCFRSVSRSINQPINHPVSQSVNSSISKPVYSSMNQPVCSSNIQISQSTSCPISYQTKQINQPTETGNKPYGQLTIKICHVNQLRLINYLTDQLKRPTNTNSPTHSTVNQTNNRSQPRLKTINQTSQQTKASNLHSIANLWRAILFFFLFSPQSPIHEPTAARLSCVQQNSRLTKRWCSTSGSVCRATA